MTSVPAPRVLVVDDEPDIVALVVYHLARAGYRVSSAATGPDAVAVAKRERPALVVLDLMLPHVDGWSIIRDVRRWAPTLPIIVMTARRAEIALTEVLADSIATITAVIVVLIEESTLTRPNRWPLVRVSSLRIFTACRCQSCSTSPSRKE